MTKTIIGRAFFALILAMNARAGFCQMSDTEIFWHAIAKRLEYQLPD
jgi:hypothetical protein